MYSTAAKENSTPSKSSQPFFSKREGSNFFSSTKDVSKPFFSPAVIQPKLTINEPGDKYEQEADAMADRVMRMPLAPIFSPTGRVEVAQRSEKEEEEQVQRKEQIAASDWGRQPVIVQRKCADCEEEEKLQRQETEEEEPLQTKRLPPSGEIEGGLMRKAEGGGYTASPQLSSQLDSSKGGGNPLPKQTLGFMNQAFGADFSKVRVHTGAQAAEMSQGIQAKAFTHGSDVYFNRGQYSPESSEGKRLLGHELTHVVQQGPKTSVKYLQRQGVENEEKRKEAAQLGDEHAKIIKSKGYAYFLSHFGDPEKRYTDRHLRAIYLFPIKMVLLELHQIPRIGRPGNIPGPVQMPPNVQAEIQEARRLVTEYEASWSVIISRNKSFSQVSSWIKEGSEVIRLLKIHTESAIRASMKGQSRVYQKYHDIITGDILLLDFIYYHILVHINFLHNQPNIQPVWDIINKHSFTGRPLAIAYLKAYEERLNEFIKNELNRLGLITYFDILIDIDDSGKLVERTTISSGSVSGTQPVFKRYIAELILMEKSYKDAIDKINKHLGNISVAQMVLLDVALILAGRGGRGSAPRISAPRPTPRPAAPAPRPAAPAPAPRPAAPAPAPRPAAPAPAQKPPTKPAQQQQKPPKQQKQRQKRGVTCFGRSFVLQIPSALPNHVCPLADQRIDGPSITMPRQDLACKAAKHAFNAMMLRGCKPKHVDCVCK